MWGRVFKKISIRGLRGFRSKLILSLAMPNGKFGSGLTIITGPNNSGKSTILEAFKYIGSTAQNPTFNSSIRNSKDDTTEITAVTESGTYKVSSLSKGSSQTTYDPKCPDSPYIIPSRRFFSPFFGRASAIDRINFSRSRSSHTVAREQTMSQFEGRIFKIEGEKNKFDKLLRRIVPDFSEWAIDTNENEQCYIKVTSKSGQHSFHGSGDGILSIFVIVAALYDSPIGDTIIIDEPELSLHPNLQKRLSKILCEYSANRQVIIATHSPYFIENFAIRNGASIVRLWQRNGGISAFSINASNCPELITLTSTNLNNPHVFGMDAKEIFFENDRIVILEGQEDVIFLSKLDPVGKLDGASIFGWGSGGAANMTNVCGVLHALGHNKVVGILDNNRPDDIAALRKSWPGFGFFELPAPDIRTKKAQKARSRVDGVVGQNGRVRTIYAKEVEELISNIVDFMQL